MIRKISSLVLLMILLSSFASAFGVSYIWGRPLEMYQGETKEIYLTLQNNAEPDRTITAATEFIDNAGIATLTDENTEYTVPYGVPVQVNMSISIPENANIGETYSIKIRFLTAPESGGGLGLGTGTGTTIDVLVIERAPTVKEPTETLKEKPFKILTYIYSIIITLIIIVIILIALSIKKKKPVSFS